MQEGNPRLHKEGNSRFAGTRVFPRGVGCRKGKGQAQSLAVKTTFFFHFHSFNLSKIPLHWSVQSPVHLVKEVEAVDISLLCLQQLQCDFLFLWFLHGEQGSVSWAEMRR